ncbi:hypothetical protein SSBR45G_20050 [Bradyrhizobium sp. SSBR45G]|uniref:DUF2274 domain-containing protein n=1 Tax=unclassified Bradyrhizobium TaxID=2631580 RepID=UPI00234298E2|nr:MULTISPECIES: DUF2274 domain-containing protein [unclassified Bradyrhizobium]GLH77097.1 hypothetical protein SSBR45G_20050 [Bradyrhizobium sp. SSBR45G]GLH83855.1 hypothetical protein SSBR45R_13150 [Bradyrhizobium sp. SSBR45R]
MAKLKISSLPDDKPVKLTVEFPENVHRDLQSYAQILSKEAGQTAPDIARLVGAMVARFMLTDRAFVKWKRSR